MSAREYMVYEWTCDRCGEVEGDEIDAIPDNWQTEDDGDFCGPCSLVVRVVTSPVPSTPEEGS